MSLVRNLYKIAQVANNITILASGNPKRITRRAKNIVVGKALRKAGFFKWLWK